MTNKRPVLILGGGSDIGLAIARRFAAEGHPIQLAARRPGALETARADLALRHRVEVSLHVFDALDLDGIEAFYDGLPETPSVVVCAVGLLGDQEGAERDPRHARLIAETNFLGPAVAVEAAARRLAALDEDTAIIAISSVAGDRGRAKNYWYGAAKAAFTTMLSGLRQRYSRTRLHVITMKPGYVMTKMVEGLDVPKLLAVAPDTIADAVMRAYRKKRHGNYGSLIWRLIALIIVHLPEPIFKKTKF